MYYPARILKLNPSPENKIKMSIRKNKRNNYIKIEETCPKPVAGIVEKTEKMDLMTARISEYGFKTLKCPEDVVRAFGMLPEECSQELLYIKKIMTQFPYHSLKDVSHVFDLKGIIPGHCFDVAEMPIVNGVQLLSPVGVYKVLLLSDISVEEKRKVIEEYKTGKKMNIKTRFIQKKTKLPSVMIADVEYSKVDESLPGLGAILVSLGAKPEVIDEVSNKVFLKSEEKRMTIGCIRKEDEDVRLICSGENLKVKRAGSKAIVLSKKFFPIRKVPIVLIKDFYEELLVHYPETFLRAYFNNSGLPLASIYLGDGKKGFLYEHTNGTRYVEASVTDKSTDTNIAKGFPVTNLDLVSKVTKDWSFARIVDYFGQ